MKEKLMIIDGTNLVFRAFYGVPLFVTKKGEYTNAVLGFVNMFLKLIEEEKPNYVAIAFDLPKPTFRHEMFEAYKGTRTEMPSELIPQLGLVKELLVKMKVPVVEKEGFEADDVLGTLSLRGEKEGLDVVVVSGDRDMLQLASDVTKIRIPRTKGGKTEVEDYYASDLIEKMGVTPTEFIDVKALMGDTSDNIPGVPSIGEKTALKIITEYKSLEKALEHAADVKPKRASENLVTYREQAIMSKTLATILRDIPLEEKFQDFTFSSEAMINQETFDMISRLEMRSLMGRFQVTDAVAAEKNEDVAITYVSDFKEGEKLVKSFTEKYPHTFVGYDLDLDTREKPWRCRGIAFANKAEEAVYIGTHGGITPEQLDSLIRLFFEMGNTVDKIGYDTKRDCHYLKQAGISVQEPLFDVSIGAYLLNTQRTITDEMEQIEKSVGKTSNKGEEQLSLMDLGGSEQAQSQSLDNWEERGKRSCDKALYLWGLYQDMKRDIEEKELHTLYYGIEIPLVDVLVDMEEAGIKVDRKALTEYGAKLETVIHTLTAEIYDLAGEEFNINSPKQMGVILFDKLGLTGGKKTKTGWSTSVEVLQSLIGEHEIIAKIMEYRTHTKLKSTYVDGLLAVLDPETDKIHSTFNQTVAATGRLSSTEPNLQNIPIRTPLGRELRKIFIPTNSDYVFVDGDYSQIELRILASVSKDETFIRGFNEGLDIHRLTASQVFHTPFEEVTDTQRSNAKAVNFGIVYGISAYSLSQDLGITVKAANEYIEGYFEKYPNVKAFLDKSIADAKKNGYATTLTNRRRYIPELTSSNFNMRSFGERVAMNMPIQGTAADIIKIAMIQVHSRLKRENLRSRVLLQVHDELLLEVHRDELEIVKKLLKEEMECTISSEVPFEVDIHSGETWFEAK